MTTEVEYRFRCDLCGEYTKDSFRVTVPDSERIIDVCGLCQQRPIADLAAKVAEGTGF